MKIISLRVEANEGKVGERKEKVHPGPERKVCLCLLKSWIPGKCNVDKR